MEKAARHEGKLSDRIEKTVRSMEFINRELAVLENIERLFNAFVRNTIRKRLIDSGIEDPGSIWINRDGDQCIFTIMFSASQSDYNEMRHGNRYLQKPIGKGSYKGMKVAFMSLDNSGHDDPAYLTKTAIPETKKLLRLFGFSVSKNYRY